MTKLTREDVIEKHKKGESLGGLNLSGLDLSGLDLSCINLYTSNLYKTNLSNSDLSHAILFEANLFGANLTNAILSYAHLRGAILDNIIGKNILTFQAYGKDFSYFCDGIIKIACRCLKPDDWLSNYKELAKIYNYDEKSIKSYLAFINHCKELTYGQINA